MAELLDEAGFGLLDDNLFTNRTLVRQGVAAYFGGTFVNNIRAYQNGPLVGKGLGTVRAGWGKRLNMQDFVQGMPPGRNAGAFMIVAVGQDREVRRAMGGPPAFDGSGNIIAGGIKWITYRVTLYVFHLAQKGYAEDAQADVDLLIEAIKQQIRGDRTLGGICTQAGEGRFGIQVIEDPPGIDENDRTGTRFTVQFEILTQIIA